MLRLLLIRAVAALLLAVQGHALVLGGARPSNCACTHDAASPCGCPTHAQGATATVDDSKLPPCHRHRAHASKAAPGLEEKPCLRARCVADDPQLHLLAWVALPSLLHAVRLTGTRHDRLTASNVTRPAPTPAAPPPRAHG